MIQNQPIPRSQAQISRAAIQRLFVSMRHLILRGAYKPLGVSGESMIQAMLSLQPEIYGLIADEEKVELDGLLYVFQRLPKGIEECRYIKLISREGYEHSNFEKHVPPSRRRNCYRVDEEQYFIEMTRGGSDIYDILTHLTFMYIEAEKIRRNSMDVKGRKNRSWLMLEKLVEDLDKGLEIEKEVGFTYLNTILGRTYDQVEAAYKKFEKAQEVNDLFKITYWLGRLSMDEYISQIDREITFSPALRESLGHHIYGERWANHIKQTLWENNIFDRPIHIISSNLHSVMNCFYAKAALGKHLKYESLEEYAEALSVRENGELREKVVAYALKNGMIELSNTKGTNIGVHIFDTEKIDANKLPKELKIKQVGKMPVIIVMDYAFGEQAYETMDELLKPFVLDEERHRMNVVSVNIMGKAGILHGNKGDIMIPTAHVFEGTADNYPFDNALSVENFEGCGLGVYAGTMISVLGTSLQNKDILNYFAKSSWKAIGLEMEGAHYQKAIQAASKIRKNINEDVVLRYAYYASDNPLETGGTLASGSLGMDGVKPTYLITLEILKGCLQ
ncbi:MAG: hypothetical protein J5I52_12145 [Saprospiraceae bacterium]|nr:MAG: hypothetical protein UZ09_BCD002001326 [Bacteroidetes bacterium OLB9]MCO6464887.1 hypothetical protein [Saprospiraceae bacterium]MCZ2338562.1 hypothetical protein [Chitinophagales bacterium]